MAIMLPDRPRDFDKNSLEDIMFDALERLPDDYYVFHSFKIVKVVEGELKESETDFVIFNKAKGILCLEAKAGLPSYHDERWFYSSGIEMAHGGPYKQADANKWKLKKYIEDKGFDDIIRNCKLLHAVWFPSVTEIEFCQINFPSDGDKKLTLIDTALDEPQKYLDEIFDISIPGGVKTNLSGYQIKRLFNSVLCPSFNLVPSLRKDYDSKRRAFNRLLKEQAKLLDYLEDQNTAVINGVAGSGKTMIAIEKARRCSAREEKVLFLCYNRLLCEYLKDNYKDDNISFYTLDALACKVCDTSVADLTKLNKRFEELFYEQQFPYKHVIIDEAQDFGQDSIEESNIIDTLESIVLDESVNGTFYLFYDKLQLVQGKKIPSYIQDADCKLTLYKNCRNTENIAISSLRPFPGIRKPQLSEYYIRGESPSVFFAYTPETMKEQIDTILERCQSEKIEDVVILTCKTVAKSLMVSYIGDEVYKYKGVEYKFTTCRKYKGLEADVIILIDVDKNVFTSDTINNYYVGSSRARFGLNIGLSLSDEEIPDVLGMYGKDAKRRPQKSMAAFLNAKLI